MSYSALILDCDGVIVDSEPFSCKAWNIIFQNEYAIDIGTNYDLILGKNTRAAILHYFQKHDLDISESTIQHLSVLKEQTYLNLATGKLTTIQGVERIIEQARELGWKLAVASSGIAAKINFSLAQVSLQDKFDAIVGSEGIEGKPAPDIFLEAARRLATIPQECVVIEDTPAGITAANRANMYVIGIATTFPRQRLEHANLVVNAFEEVDLGLLP
ncbi:MAG: HAD family hydrolase [Candidatus Hodarchaeales archaeon]|jgi:HAD superfamily hydrolase (TIGR01509 family)